MGLISQEAQDRNRAEDLKNAEEAEARKGHNPGPFVQVGKKAFKDLSDAIGANPGAMSLLMYMVSRMNRTNALCASHSTLATLMGVTDRSIRNWTAWLAKHKWIEIVKTGSSSAYVTNSAVFWQTYNTKRYSTFNATILSCEDEQANPIPKVKETIQHFPFVSIPEENRKPLIVEGPKGTSGELFEHYPDLFEE